MMGLKMIVAAHQLRIHGPAQQARLTRAAASAARGSGGAAPSAASWGGREAGALGEAAANYTVRRGLMRRLLVRKVAERGPHVDGAFVVSVRRLVPLEDVLQPRIYLYQPSCPNLSCLAVASYAPNPQTPAATYASSLPL